MLSHDSVRYWHIADMRQCAANVRFRGYSGHHVCTAKCPLMTQSGHGPFNAVACAEEFRLCVQNGGRAPLQYVPLAERP